MAKLGPYYALCPLIDSKSILGISEDVDRGIVIATLGKNIASRYKLSDQKHISCWRTKEKFSTNVLYDKSLSKYLAVFNQSYIKTWDTEENLDKAKKYKFNKQIFNLISDGENTFVIFNNCAIYKLNEALEQRKSLNPEGLKEIDVLLDVLYKNVNGDFYIGLIVKSNDNEQSLYWTKYNYNQNKFSNVLLEREDVELKGYAFHAIGNTVYLLTCWSDSAIYSSLLDPENESNSIGELFATIEPISMKHSISLMSLDENYIAMYGANSNDEGAMLIIYNTQFKVAQTRQPFKLFTEGARIWCIENNLLLPVGQNLAVIPFYLETEQLAALVGSHRMLDEVDADIQIVQEVEVTSWDFRYKVRQKKLSGVMQERIEEMLKQGLPESLISEKILNDNFEKYDVDLLEICIRELSDIPEKLVVKTLKYVLDMNIKSFRNGLSDIDKLPEVLQPLQRLKIINSIFRRSFNEILILPHLRSELSLNDAVLLLNYICLMWIEERSLPALNLAKTQAILLEWILVLIDSNYQKFVVSKDQTVIDVFNELNRVTCETLNFIGGLESLEPILNNIKHRKPLHRDQGVNLRYSVEQLSLY